MQGGRKMTKRIVNLPEDLICDILSRLPTKSLIRFMCVSRTWNSLIQDPYLTQLRHQNLDNHFLVVCSTVDYSEPITKFEPGIFIGHIPTHEDQGSVELNNSTHILSMPKVSDFYVHYVNGLICSYPSPRNCNTDIAIHICNPTTRQVVTLPRDNNLDFYPKFNLITNFGYDPLEDNYKVLNVILTETNLFLEFRILTVGDNVWRNVGHAIPFDLMSNIVRGHEKRIGTCVNGAIHWLDIIRNVILVFDLRIEQFREIPIFEFDIMNITCITLFSGHLSLVNHCYVDDRGIDMLILKDYKNHERMFLSIQDSFLKYGRLVPLCKTHTQEIILLSSYTRGNQVGLLYYDTKTRSSRRICAVKGRPLSSYEEYLDWSWTIHYPISFFLYQENFKHL
jgi:F-box interacting protein